MGTLIVAFIWSQLILVPVLGILWLAARKERQRYQIYATEVLNHVWHGTKRR